MSHGNEVFFPDDVRPAFTEGGIDEAGNIRLGNANKENTISYVTTHWKELLDQVDNLPVKDPNKKSSKRRSIRLLGSLCEFLPPEEYLDFLNRWVGLAENKKIDSELLLGQFMGYGKKRHFVTVNYEESRIQSLLNRSQRAVSKEEDPEFHEWIDSALVGDMADSYFMDDEVVPETLPGIKLRDPIAKLMAEARERNRGNQRGSKDAKQPEHLRESKNRIPSGSEESAKSVSSETKWSIAGVCTVILLGVLWFFRKSKKS